jgi:hypothetical protein
MVAKLPVLGHDHGPDQMGRDLLERNPAMDDGHPGEPLSEHQRRGRRIDKSEEQKRARDEYQECKYAERKSAHAGGDRDFDAARDITSEPNGPRLPHPCLSWRSNSRLSRHDPRLGRRSNAIPIPDALVAWVQRARVLNVKMR